MTNRIRLCSEHLFILHLTEAKQTQHTFDGDRAKRIQREKRQQHTPKFLFAYHHEHIWIYKFIDRFMHQNWNASFLCARLFKTIRFPRTQKKNITFPAWNYISYACRMRKTMKSEKRFWPFSVISFVKARAKTKRKTRIWRERKSGEVNVSEREMRMNRKKMHEWIFAAVGMFTRWEQHSK